MTRNFRKFVIAAACGLGALTTATLSYAAPVATLPVTLNVGDTNTNLGTVFPSGLGAAIMDSGVQNFNIALAGLTLFPSTDPFKGTIQSQVFKTGTGTLDFLYTITSSSVLTHAIDELDFTGMAAYKIGVGEGGTPSSPFSIDPVTGLKTVAQDHAERPTADQVNFHYHGLFAPGQTTSFLLQTDATSFNTGSSNLGIEFEGGLNALIDDQPASGDTGADEALGMFSVFAPTGPALVAGGGTPLPKGGYAALLGLAAMGLTLRRMKSAGVVSF